MAEIAWAHQALEYLLLDSNLVLKSKGEEDHGIDKPAIEEILLIIILSVWTASEMRPKRAVVKTTQTRQVSI